jgi:hypothetical protein
MRIHKGYAKIYEGYLHISHKAWGGDVLYDPHSLDKQLTRRGFGVRPLLIQQISPKNRAIRSAVIGIEKPPRSRDCDAQNNAISGPLTLPD